MQSHKSALVIRISIAVLIFVISITAVSLFLKVSQNKEIEDTNNQVQTAENNLAAQRNKEEVLLALKNRLNLIKSLSGGDEKVKSMLSLIIYLTPPDVDLYDASVDKNGTIAASFSSKSLTGVDTLFSNLSSKEKNSNLISKVDLDGISLGKDLTYRFALKISSVK